MSSQAVASPPLPPNAALLVPTTRKKVQVQQQIPVSQHAIGAPGQWAWKHSISPSQHMGNMTLDPSSLNIATMMNFQQKNKPDISQGISEQAIQQQLKRKLVESDTALNVSTMPMDPPPAKKVAIEQPLYPAKDSLPASTLTSSGSLPVHVESVPKSELSKVGVVVSPKTSRKKTSPEYMSAQAKPPLLFKPTAALPTSANPPPPPPKKVDSAQGNDRWAIFVDASSKIGVEELAKHVTKLHDSDKQIKKLLSRYMLLLSSPCRCLSLILCFSCLDRGLLFFQVHELQTIKVVFESGEGETGKRHGSFEKSYNGQRNLPCG
jgi:hypothetical protein